MQVPLTSVLSVIMLKEQIYIRQIIGMIISFMVFVIIVRHPSVIDNIWPFNIVIIATFFFAF
ncbi:MAG: hypothetical protein AB8U25_02155 [Rickettsiales endosymbiont of Dermacentor nuttalli]